MSSDFWTEMRGQRFGVRLMAALDLLFPRLFVALGRFLARCPKWLTKASDEDREWLAAEVEALASRPAGGQQDG